MAKGRKMNRYLVSFDFWNTIVTNVSYKKRRLALIREFLKERGFDRSADEIQNAYGSIRDRIKQNKMHEENKYTDLEERMAVVLGGLNVSYERSMALELIDVLQRPVWDDPPPLIQEIVDILRYLSAFSDIACISDTGMTKGTTIRGIMEWYGIDQYFKYHVFSEDIGRNKPDGRMFYPLLHNEEGIPKEQIFHVGDLFDTDVVGATNCGINAIWYVNQPSEIKEMHEGSNVMIITSLAQIRDILRGD